MSSESHSTNESFPDELTADRERLLLLANEMDASPNGEHDFADMFRQTAEDPETLAAFVTTSAILEQDRKLNS